MVEARKHFKVVQNHKSRRRAVFQVWGQNVSVLLVLNSRQKRLPVTLSSGNPLLSQDTEKQKAYGGKRKEIRARAPMKDCGMTDPTIVIRLESI